MDLLLTGKTFSRQKHKISFITPSVIQVVSFYPGEGVVFDMPFVFEKKYDFLRLFEICYTVVKGNIFKKVLFNPLTC